MAEWDILLLLLLVTPDHTSPCPLFWHKAPIEQTRRAQLWYAIYAVASRAAGADQKRFSLAHPLVGIRPDRLCFEPFGLIAVRFLPPAGLSHIKRKHWARWMAEPFYSRLMR